MSSREEYLKTFKAKLDEWDADIDRLEAKANEAQADAQEQYHKQLDNMREMRKEAMARYSEMQDAAFDEARSKFKGSGKG
jgi:phage host-nuclease inhibitor protein Gam